MKLFGIVIMVVLVFFIVAALVGPIANFTFNPLSARNGTVQRPQNISQTSLGDGSVKTIPGLTTILQLYPIFFVLVSLLFIAKSVGDFGSRNWTSESDNSPLEEPELEEKPEHYYPPWNCSNCAGPNPENHPMCQYCGEAYSPMAVRYK